MLFRTIVALIAALGVRADNNPSSNGDSGAWTVQDMLSTPRPAFAYASPDGQHAINTVDVWDPKTDKSTRSVYLLDTQGGSEPKKLYSGSSAQLTYSLWLSGDTVAYLNGTALQSFSVGDSGPLIPGKVLTHFPSGIEASSLQYRNGHLVFSAAVWDNGQGSLNETAAKDAEWKNRGTSGVVYDDLYVRHFDIWRTPGRVYVLGATDLDPTSFEGSGTFRNLMQGTNLYSQVDAIQRTEFSLSDSHVAVALKPTDRNVAIYTRLDVQLIPLPGGGNPVNLTPYEHGAISSVVFSPDGKKVMWLEMAKDGYESDRNVVVVHTLNDAGDAAGETAKWTENWDRSPTSVVWDINGETVFLTAPNEGSTLPYRLDCKGATPHALLHNGSTSGITTLAGKPNSIVISKQSMVLPPDMYRLDIGDNCEDLHRLTDYSSAHIAGKLDDIHQESIWFQGDEGKWVQAWVVTPPGFSKDDSHKSWPMIFLVHGGPQSSWLDSWSTRWSLPMFASQGYFIVAVNPTGSTGFGQDFVDRIQNHWGDRPFEDLRAGYKTALDKYPWIDPSRTTAAGASYGGYMMNWFNGHNNNGEFGEGFKALFNHDGLFSTRSMFWSTEELWFPIQDFGGTPTTPGNTIDKWDPSNFVDQWCTPMLVVHGALDFRLAEAEGLSTFNALQYKGTPSKLLYFPDEPHWINKQHNSVKWHAEFFAWFAQWVGAGKK